MLLVRADGNAKIGAGHLMRCLTIIDAYAELRGTKEDILFVCADALSAALVQERGYLAHVLGTDYRDMTTELAAWEEMFAANKTLRADAKKSFEKEPGLCGRNREVGDVTRNTTILVDSYYITADYLQALQAYGRVVLLDDMQREAYPVDVVVNYNIFAEEEKYRELYGQVACDRVQNSGGMKECDAAEERRGVMFCIGGKFVPIRPQFRQVDYTVSDEVRDVLITTGGGDVDNIAGAILQAIYCPKLRYHLVIGQFNPHRETLERFAAQHDNVELHMNVQDMAGLMGRCDLAITAGGTTIYELSAMGVPFICFSYAENQEALTEYLGRQGIAAFAGAYHKEPERVLECMKSQVKVLCEDFEKRLEAFQKERELVDGQGARRLAHVLLGEN